MGQFSKQWTKLLLLLLCCCCFFASSSTSYNFFGYFYLKLRLLLIHRHCWLVRVYKINKHGAAASERNSIEEINWMPESENNNSCKWSRNENNFSSTQKRASERRTRRETKQKMYIKHKHRTKYLLLRSTNDGNDDDDGEQLINIRFQGKEKKQRIRHFRIFESRRRRTLSIESSRCVVCHMLYRLTTHNNLTFKQE